MNILVMLGTLLIIGILTGYYLRPLQQPQQPQETHRHKEWIEIQKLWETLEARLKKHTVRIAKLEESLDRIIAASTTPKKEVTKKIKQHPPATPESAGS